MRTEDLKYEYDHDCGMDEIIDETQNSYTAMRMVRWREGGEFKLDIRKYVMGSDGEEKPMKGIALTEDGAHTLSWALIKHGYGDARGIVNALYERDRDSLIQAVAQATIDDKAFVKDYKKALEDIESQPKVQDARFVLGEALGV